MCRKAPACGTYICFQCRWSQEKPQVMFRCVKFYVAMQLVCLCSCKILRFLPFLPFAGSGSLRTNILSTCGFHILTQLLLSDVILPQSGKPQSWPQNMERMKLYSMFVTSIGSHWKNISTHTCCGLITQIFRLPCCSICKCIFTCYSLTKEPDKYSLA